MRRIPAILAVLLISALGCLGTAMAAPPGTSDLPPDAEVVFEVDPIVDSEVLFQRAKAGVTDLPGDQEEVLASIVGPPGVKLNKYVTTQKTKEIRWHNGGRTRYVTTAIYEVALPRNTSEGQVGIMSVDDDDKTDRSASWTIYLALTYDRVYDVDGAEYGQIQSVKGKWVRHDSQVTCKDALLRAGCGGKRYEGGWNASRVKDKVIGYPSSGTQYTFTSSAFSDWGHTMFADYQGMAVMGNYIVGAARSTLTRGSSTWYLDLDVVKGKPDADWGTPR